MSITKKQKEQSHWGNDATQNNINFGIVYTPKNDLEKENNND